MLTKTQVSRRTLHKLCQELAGAPTLADCIVAIERFADRRNRKSTWFREFRKLAGGLAIKRPSHRIFVRGNSKLPFWSFSTLPQYTCPGAGACLKYCYSFTSWRYPAAVARQIQNTLLLRFHPSIIATAFLDIPIGATVRLYVDGDISSDAILSFWFRLLNRRRDIQAYGYSKSYRIFDRWLQSGNAWPTNYVLNLSNGSKYDGTQLADSMLSLPITRGRFLAVPVKGWDIGFRRYELPEYHTDVRAAARVVTGQAKVLSCPGNCGNCLPNGQHACGTMKLHGITIANGAH